MDTLATCKYPRSTGPDFWECACSIRKECAEYRILVASPDLSGTRETELPQRSGRCLFRIPNSELIVFAYFRTSRFSLFLTFPLPSFFGTMSEPSLRPGVRQEIGVSKTLRPTLICPHRIAARSIYWALPELKSQSPIQKPRYERGDPSCSILEIINP